MPDDPDHVLDSIDGAVDEWLAMSDDSMRWSPPEKAAPRHRLGLPVPPLPEFLDDLLHELGDRLGPPAQAAVDAVRPLGEGVVDAVSAFLDTPAVRQLLQPPGGHGRPAIMPPGEGGGSPADAESPWEYALGAADDPGAAGADPGGGAGPDEAGPDGAGPAEAHRGETSQDDTEQDDTEQDDTGRGGSHRRGCG
ncbi:hypothetical protein FHS43_005862 [Streptosporangium becharense]|uniref:Uncharacterized protein n=1 Tax=Streptosporangium becharense TaxID=1816182 RepID=A0A7W9IMD8_9ACTN|nr:hypothetical protein [Streptosporangium becharense]MBB2914550.1 hypothetical protein [Streptosporangium becharense]MBB5823395.1 hypothetical protein [Streptosporangium becharense]